MLATVPDEPRARLSWWRPVAAVLVLGAVLGGWFVQREFAAQRERAQARITSMGELRVGQVASWIERQMNLAAFLSGGRNLSELLDRVLDAGDETARQRLLTRTTAFRRANDADGALVLDAQGRMIAAEVGIADSNVPGDLRAAVLRAVASATPVHTGIYDAGGQLMRMRLDVVVPLLRADGPPRGVVVMRMDPQRALFPLLSNWPLAPSGESILWRKAGDELVNVSDTRFGDAGPGTYREPVTRSRLVAARMLRGEIGPGEPVRTLDYRGTEVIAAGWAVPGTDWWLVAKIDAAEIDAASGSTAWWTAAGVLFAAIVAGLAARLQAQRRAMQRLELHDLGERERLRGLQLLEAIAASASHAIYAKDLEGRYVFCNRAAALVLGKTPDEIVGKNDEAVFGATVAAERRGRDRLALEAGRPTPFDETLWGGDLGPRQVRCTRGPLHDATGTLIGLLGVSHDITEARRAERALRDSEAHYRTVVSALGVGVVVSDANGNVMTCNPAAERIFGTVQGAWQPNEPVAPGWTFHREDGTDMPAAETPQGRVLAGEPAQHGVLLQARNPQGEPFWFEVSATPMPREDGTLPTVVTSFNEVTQRLDAINHAQLALSAAKDDPERWRDATETASRAQSAFLANMSHEIRTPMNASISLARPMPPDPRDPTQHDAIARVVRRPDHIELPAGEPGEAEASLRLRHAGQRVLLAEDNPVNRDVASELIRSAGLVIECAEDGARAVELACSRHYDLILMDMQMPVMDGLAATRRIRQQAGREVPIVALTANAFVDDRAACLAAGMNDHVSKPVDPDVLYASLLRWLPLVDAAAAAATKAPPAAPVHDLPVGSLRDRLASVQGLALDIALRNVGGKLAVVERVLARFSESYRHGVAEFAATEDRVDPQALRQACHSLRGACAAIGAAEIETDLRQFEATLSEADASAEIGARAALLNRRLKTFVGTLEIELQR